LITTSPTELNRIPGSRGLGRCHAHELRLVAGSAVFCGSCQNAVSLEAEIR
jgi:hypothetical protein